MRRASRRPLRRPLALESLEPRDVPSGLTSVLTPAPLLPPTPAPLDAPGRLVSLADRATPSAPAGEARVRIVFGPVIVTPLAETSGLLPQLVAGPSTGPDLTVNPPPRPVEAGLGDSTLGVGATPSAAVGQGEAGTGAQVVASVEVDRVQLVVSIAITTEQISASVGTNQGQAAGSTNADAARSAMTANASARSSTSTAIGTPTVATAAVATAELPAVTLPARAVEGSAAFVAPTAPAASSAAPGVAAPVSIASRLGSSGSSDDADLLPAAADAATGRPAPPKVKSPEDKGTDATDPAVPPPARDKAVPPPAPKSGGENGAEEGTDRVAAAVLPEFAMPVLVAGEEASLPAVSPESGRVVAAAFPPGSRTADEGAESQEAQGGVQGRAAPLWVMTGAATVLAAELRDRRVERGRRTQAEVSLG